MSVIRTEITKDGQAYLDTLEFAHPRQRSKIEELFAGMFKRPTPQPIAIGYSRTNLRWMKRGPDGTITPR